jgi:hypothetical protein
MHRLLVWLAFLSLGSAPAFADQNGVSVSKPYSCGSDAMSTLLFLCDGLKSIGVKSDACTVTGDSCTNASQELFSGLNIEFATPGNIKNWSGFGGTGEAYAIGALCLLKDLKDTPMTSKADAWKGTVTAETTVGFTSFDPKTLRLEGWHRARACAPVVGCFDGFTQRFTLQSVKTNLANSPEKVGQYQVQSTHALDLTTQGQAQALLVEIPAFEVITPYGKVEAAPHFGYAKAVGWVLAPYAANNLKSTWKNEIAPPVPALMAVDSRPHMIDLYGRIPGLKHSQIMPGPLPGQGSLVGQRYNPSHGWISQAGLGGRTIPEDGIAWKPPAGVEYPERPDFAFDPAGPRSDTERTPNLAMGADVKLDYSPTDLLPSWVQKAMGGFLTVDFHVWVQPAVATAFSSQLHLMNMEAATWHAHPQGSPLPPYSPDTFYQAHEFHARAGSSAAAAFKVTAGVDLTIKLEIELVFTTIRETLINIHPRYTFVDFKDDGQNLSKQTAQAGTYTEHFLSTGQLFKTYRQLNGTQSNGVQHIQQCLAAPKTTGAPPPDPTLEPGDPEDLVDMVDWPCNICIGAWDTAGTVKKTGAKVSYPAWVQTIFPAQVNNRPPAVRTRCDAIQHAGCLDRCSWNKATNVLTVVETAQEMFAAGKATGGGARCSTKLAPLPPG